MGEYAIRKWDNERVKIGTCESMYYLRFEDKDKVEPCQGSGFGYFWRLPFPDEDDILPGEYGQYNRGYRLFKKVETPGIQPDYHQDFTDPTTTDTPGIMQLRHECGMMLNVNCYHGEILPAPTDDIKPFWNGRSWFYELKCLREADGKMYPVVECRHCRHAWRYTWEEILPYIQDQKLKKRLEKYI